jgi:RND family efflux transporter MFP subunit
LGTWLKREMLTRVDTRTNVDGAKSDLTKQIQEQNAIVEGLYQQYLSGDLQAYSLDDNDRDIIPPVISGSYLGSKEGEYILDVYSSNANSGYSFRLSGLESGTYTAEVNRAGKLGESGLYIQFIDNNSYGNTEWSVPVPNKRSSTYLARKTAYQNSITTRERIISNASTNVDKTSGIDNQTQISRDEALRRQAQAQVNAVAAQLDDGKIRAPFDGYVVKHDMEIGEIISGFTPQVTLFANTTKKLELNIPEIYINKIAVGDLVEIELDAYSGEIFEGIVDFIDVIDTEVDGVPVYKSDIILLSSDERIRVGMNAKASIVADSILDVIAIPNHYIIQDNTDQKKVLIQKTVRPPQVEERIVTTGFYGNDGFVEIISGLNEGDIVLLNKK